MSVLFGPWWWPSGKEDDEKIAPCDARTPSCDFHTSVNWEWDQATTIPPDSGYVSAWTEAENGTNAVLERACKASPRLSKVFAACIARQESVDCQKMYESIMSLESWAARIAFMHAMGLRAFFEYTTHANIYTDAHVRVLFLKQGGTSLPDKAMFETHGDRLREHMRKALVLGGFDPALAEGAFEVEKHLAESHLTPSEKRGPGTFSRFDITKFWSEYLRHLNGGFEHRGDTFAENVVALRAATEAAHGRNAAAYVAWMCCGYIARTTSGDLYRSHWEFYGAVISGTRIQKSPTRRALEDVMDLFPEEVSLAFVSLNSETHRANRAAATEVVGRIRANMIAMFEKSPALSARAKASCVEKMTSMVALVGYPEDWPEAHASIADAALKHEDWHDMRVAAERARASYVLSNLGKASARTEWLEMFPHSVNASYRSDSNTILLPAAVLASTMFDLSSDETSVASAGMIVAHEMSHGFDDNGRRFSSGGKWGNWWPRADVAEYERRCARLDEQLVKVGLDPKLARGEAIADLVGMRVALDSLKVGANLKSFFEAWARLWRIKMTASEHDLQKRLDPHASGWARTVLPLRNFEEFHATFGVKPGDGMWLAPERRVSIF